MKPSHSGRASAPKVPTSQSSRSSVPSGSSNKIQARPSDGQNSKPQETPNAVIRESPSVTGSSSSLTSRIPRRSDDSMHNFTTAVANAAPMVGATAATSETTARPAGMVNRTAPVAHVWHAESRIPTPLRGTETFTIVRPPTFNPATVGRTETQTLVAAGATSSNATEIGAARSSAPSRIPKYKAPRHIPQFPVRNTTNASANELELTLPPQPEPAAPKRPKKLPTPFQRPKLGYRDKYSKGKKNSTSETEDESKQEAEDLNLPPIETPSEAAPLLCTSETFPSTPASVSRISDSKTRIEVSDSKTPVEIQDFDAPFKILNMQAPTEIQELETPIEISDSKTPIEISDSKTPIEIQELDTPTEGSDLQAHSKIQELETPFEISDSRICIEMHDVDTPIEISDSETPIDVHEHDTPIEIQDFDTPTEILNLETPIEKQDCDTPTEGSDLKTPVEIQDFDTPTETSGLKTPIETQGFDPPTEASDLKTPIEIQDIDTPIEISDLKRPVEQQDVNTPIKPPSLKTFVETTTSKTENKIPFLKTPFQFPPFEVPKRRSSADFWEYGRTSNLKLNVDAPAVNSDLKTPIELSECSDVSEPTSDTEIFEASAEPANKSPVNKIPIPINEPENKAKAPAAPVITPRRPVKKPEPKPDKLAEAKARRAKAAEFAAKLRNPPKVLARIVEQEATEESDLETEEDKRSVAEIDAKIKKLDANIAAAEAAEAKDKSSNPSDFILDPDIITLKSTPVSGEFGVHSSEFMTDEESNEAIDGVVQDVKNAEFSKRKQSGDVQFLLHPREFECSSCEIGTAESGPCPQLEADVRPRDLNNNIIDDLDASQNLEDSVVEIYVGEKPWSESTCSFKSCEETTAMKMNFLDPRMFTADGDYDERWITKLWQQVVLELRQELETAQTPSRRRIRLPRIQEGPGPVFPQPKFSVSANLVVNRISSTFLPIRPNNNNEDHRTADVTQRELEMLFRARFPKVFTEDDLPVLNRVVRDSEGYYVKEFQTANPGYTPPVRINSQLFVDMKWFGFAPGIFGNIVLKNKSPYVVTYRVRASTDDRYRVTPPIGCVRAGNKVKIYMETHEGYGFDAYDLVQRDQLMIELIPITEPFKNMYLLYVFWAKIPLAEYRHVIEAILPRLYCDSMLGKLDRHLVGSLVEPVVRDYRSELLRMFITLLIMKLLIYFNVLPTDRIHSYRAFDFT